MTAVVNKDPIDLLIDSVLKPISEKSQLEQTHRDHLVIIRHNLATIKLTRDKWNKVVLEIGATLLTMREACGDDDRKFGEALDRLDKKLKGRNYPIFKRTERIALIKMSKEPKKLEAILTKSNSWSIQNIYRKHFQKLEPVEASATKLKTKIVWNNLEEVGKHLEKTSFDPEKKKLFDETCNDRKFFGKALVAIRTHTYPLTISEYNLIKADLPQDTAGYKLFTAKVVALTGQER